MTKLNRGNQLMKRMQERGGVTNHNNSMLDNHLLENSYCKETFGPYTLGVGLVTTGSRPRYHWE